MKAFKLIQSIILAFFFIYEVVIAQDTEEDYYHRGVEYAVRGDFDSAKAEFIQAIKIDSFYYPAKYSLVRINDAISKVIDDTTAIHLFKGVSLTIKNMYDDAVTEYSKAIKLSLEYALTYIDRGCLYFQIGKKEQAIDDFNKAIEINPNFAEAYNNKGYIYFLNYEYSKAIDEYDKAIKLNSNYYLPFHFRGLAHFYSEEDEEAIADFTKAISLYPHNAGAYNDRGVTYLYDEDYDNAINDFNKAIELHPDFAMAYFNRGRVYNSTDHFEKALSDFNKSIKLDPKLSFAYNDRGILYIEEFDDPQKGCADLKKACDFGYCQYYNKYVRDGDCP